MKKNYRDWKKEQREGNNQKKNDTENTTIVLCSDVPEILSVNESLHIKGSDKGTKWILNHETSFHATSRRESFSTYKLGNFGNSEDEE